MKKRFADADIWQKEWFQEYSLKQKVLFKYICDNCDCAGVYEPNYRLASFIIGDKITEEDVLSLNQKKHQVEILENGKIWIPDFVSFQYGELSENCRPHQSIIQLLKKYGLFERVCKGYVYPIQRDTDKEKEKEQDKDKDKEKYKRGCGGKPSIDDVKQYCFERNNSVDPEKFFDYYTANGWKVGKNPMKDWKAAVRNWEKIEQNHNKTERKESTFEHNMRVMKELEEENNVIENVF